MSAIKLGRNLKIPKKEAEVLMESYFTSFPNIKSAIDYMANFGIKNGYSKTLKPFKRRRFYPYWGMFRKNIESHISGIEYNADLGSIGRASSNAPIQGSNSDITKLAMILMYKWIRENGYVNRIFLIAQVHDEIVTECEDVLLPIWEPKMHELMVKAGQVVITNNMLGAETHSSKQWTK